MFSEENTADTQAEQQKRRKTDIIQDCVVVVQEKLCNILKKEEVNHHLGGTGENRS